MKIGILTFHRALNYGAVLQTYALRKALNNLGVDAEVVDYRCKVIEKSYAPIQFNSKNILKVVASNMFYYSTRKKMREKFNEFINLKVNLSKEKYFNIEELAKIENTYDLFITGSDQVFNYECTDFDKTYFLDFVKDDYKKNSYAASFGFDSIPNNYVEEYQRLLQGFANISVREESGRNIIKKMFEKDINISLDPVFLLSKDEWISIINPVERERKYILMYTIASPNHLIPFAENLAKKMGCELVYLNDRFKKNSTAEYIRFCSPTDFLALFAGAEYVVTNSFHGTAFSILFQKTFYCEVVPKNGKKNFRVIDLLNMLNLNEQIFNSEGINCITNSCIDYKAVNNILETQKKSALDYLDKLANGMKTTFIDAKNEKGIINE